MAVTARLSSVHSSYGRAASPIPHHRFDHMIEEQKNIVMNAQEGLNQSLLILEKAITKEELESAKLQVESLLPRCEELLTKLKVVIHVRCELGCLQKDLIKAKKSKLKATKLYARQQWLENRLERLIFSKRRARPGVRLQRGPAITHPDPRLTQRNQRMSQPQFGADQFKTHKRSATISTTCSDMFGGPSYSQRGDEEMSSTRSGSDKVTIITQSFPERESSEWNSESEANWTVLDADNNTSGKRYIQKHAVKQEKNEEEVEGKDQSIWNSQKQPKDRQEGEFSNLLQKPLSSESHDTEGDLYSFETPRSVNVFGATSWNRLCLAQYHNFVDDSNEIASGPPEEILKNPLIDNSLILLWTEVIKLQELVQSASSIMKKEGQTLPSIPSRNHLASSHNGRKQLSSIPRARTLSENDKYKLLPEISQGSTEISRKIFSKPHNVKIYPRSTFSLIDSSTKDQFTRMVFNRTESVQDFDINLSKQNKRTSSRPRSTRQKDITTLVNEHLDDYKKNTIETLIATLEDCDSIERRRDVAETMKHLKDNDKSREIIASLRKSMIKDKDAHVRYEAVKSLIKLGAWNSQLYLLVSELLVRGTTELQWDILSILLQEKCLICDNADDDKSMDDAKLMLIQSLKDLVPNSHVTNDVSFIGAVILTKANVISKENEQLFRKTLTDGTPQQMLQALECLVGYYDCVDNEAIRSSIDLVENSINWKIRLGSVECLIRIFQLEQGSRFIGHSRSIREIVMKFVKRRLISEPIHAVRVAVGTLLVYLGEKEKLLNELIRQLERTNEMERAETTIALSAFASDNSKVQNALMDVMEFDPSIFMRLLVASLIGRCKSLSSITLSRLRGKCNGTGTLAKYCQFVLAKHAVN